MSHPLNQALIMVLVIWNTFVGEQTLPFRLCHWSVFLNRQFYFRYYATICWVYLWNCNKIFIVHDNQMIILSDDIKWWINKTIWMLCGEVPRMAFSDSISFAKYARPQPTSYFFIELSNINWSIILLGMIQTMNMFAVLLYVNISLPVGLRSVLFFSRFPHNLRIFCKLDNITSP